MIHCYCETIGFAERKQDIVDTRCHTFTDDERTRHNTSVGVDAPVYGYVIPWLWRIAMQRCALACHHGHKSSATSVRRGDNLCLVQVHQGCISIYVCTPQHNKISIGTAVCVDDKPGLSPELHEVYSYEIVRSLRGKMY